jgi:hypothetical protein
MTDYPEFIEDVFAEDPQYQAAGRVNYEAFAGFLGWQQNGQPMKPFSQLLPAEQRAYSEGAYRVIQKCWRDAAPAPKHRRQR